MVQMYYRLRHVVRSTALAAAALLIVMSGIMAQEVAAQTSYACFPTCSETDGRFLSVAGVQLETLAGDVIALTFGSPSTTDSMEIGIFDGETSGYWDSGTIPLEFTLYADSAGDGTGTHQVGQWLGTVMPDNAWYTIRFANRTEARSPNGNYFYTMKIRSTNPAIKAWSNFKVRTNGTVTLRAGQAFAITAPAFTLNDARVIYPNYPSFTTTTYDGTWNFYLDVPAATGFISVWDGDMDHGSYDCVARDTNDPDTPDNVLPEWASGTAAVLEGNARGTSLCPGGGGYATGAPNDDMNNVNRRSPSIMYEVIDPNGNHYVNNNPSGNLEWEQFRISTDPFDRSQMDYHAESLPAGTYVVRMSGMDMTNLNAWRFFNDALGTMANEAMGVNAAGDPVPPLRPHGLAGTLYQDANGNSVYDNGEPTMGSVALTLQADANSDGVVDRTFTTTTDASGHFSFPNLTTGTFTVRVDSSSVVEYNPTAGFGSTSNVATLQINPGHTDPTLNLGYVLTNPHVISGTLYYDQDSSGTQGSGEGGLSGVTVRLTRDYNNDGVVDSTWTTTTSSTGAYSFASLYYGTYTVTVDASTVPAGATLLDSPGAGSASTSATITIARGDANAPSNFTFTQPVNNATVAGKLFVDANGNGTFDSGEAPMANVTVTLVAISGTQNAITTTTNASGNYSFESLAAGTYTVKMDSTMLVELVRVSATTAYQTVTLAAGQNASATNFVYTRTSPHTVTGTLYYDNNSNGVKDSGEPAMSGVTVTLAVDANSDGTFESTRTATTSSTGAYSFTSIYSGNYRLTVASSAIAADVAAVADPDGINSANTAAFTIVPGSTDPTFNFSYVRLHPHAVAGTMYYDANNNGAYNTGEPVIANVTVRLAVDANSDGTVDSTLTAVTSSSGGFSFANLYSGSYRLTVDTAGIRETTPLADPDGVSSPNTATFTLSTGQTAPSFNFGYRRNNPHAIAGTIYYDANQNYLQDAGEPGIPTVTVRFDVDANSDGVVDSTLTLVTSDNGAFTCSSLYAGRYTVRVDATTLADDIVATCDPDGTSSVHSAALTVTAGTTDPRANFGYKRANPPGTGTRGYWVNHPSAWPVNSLYLGGVFYTKDAAIAVLQRATKGDKSYSMAAQLIATKLNLAAGNNSSCIASYVSGADAWLAQYPIGSKPNNTAWNSGETIHNTLDDYNNGRMCAEHID